MGPISRDAVYRKRMPRICIFVVACRTIGLYQYLLLRRLAKPDRFLHLRRKAANHHKNMPIILTPLKRHFYAVKTGVYLFIYFIYLFIYLFGFYGPFKTISLISSDPLKGGRNPENPGKIHLTIRKQNLDFPHVTRARLEPQR